MMDWFFSNATNYFLYQANSLQKIIICLDWALWEHHQVPVLQGDFNFQDANFYDTYLFTYYYSPIWKKDPFLLMLDILTVSLKRGHLSRYTTVNYPTSLWIICRKMISSLSFMCNIKRMCSSQVLIFTLPIWIFWSQRSNRSMEYVAWVSFTGVALEVVYMYFFSYLLRFPRLVINNSIEIFSKWFHLYNFSEIVLWTPTRSFFLNYK